MSRISDKESSWEPPTDEANSKEESEDIDNIDNKVIAEKQEKSDSENYEESDFSKDDYNTELQIDENYHSNKETVWQYLNRMSQT